MAYPRFQRARAFRTARSTAGDITLNSTAWANVDTALDMTIEAQVGDVLMYTPSALTGAQTVDTYFDVVTLVSSAPLNSFAKAGAVEASPGTMGWQAWFCLPTALMTLSGPAWYTVVAGDIVSGQVTTRLRYATFSATNRTLYRNANNPLAVMLHNLGPADPE